MTPTLTWSDLTIEDVPTSVQARWLGEWGVVDGRVAFLFMNRLGCWFLARGNGLVEMLNVLTGTVERVADSAAHLAVQIEAPHWRETYLVTGLVSQLRAAGKVLEPDQCYGLAPHPALGGANPMLGQRVESRFVTIVSLALWQSICIQALRQAGQGNR